MTTVMMSRLVLNLQGFRAKQDPEQLELANRNRTGTNSAVLTTQIQSTLSERPSEYACDTRRSLSNIRHASWFGSFGDRLTDDEWGRTGVREREQSDGMETGYTKDGYDVEDMHPMVSTDRSPK
jgi:hypothetical protein